MMKFLRSQSQTVLVLVLGVIGLTFLFYGNAGNLLTASGNRTSSDYGRIDGEDLSVAELYDAVRTTRDTLVIHGQTQVTAAQIAELAWARLLMLREAEKLHIQVNDKEMLDYIRSQPLFQKNGSFDPDTYKLRLVQMRDRFHIPTDAGVDPMTTTANVLEAVLKNDLLVDATSKALFAGVRSSAHDISEKYDEYYGPTTVSFVTFDPKGYLATAQVTPADIEAAYKSDPQNPAYRTPEKRKVDYLLFMLTPDQMKLPDAQKKSAKDALGEKATKFALAFIPDPSGSAPPATDFQAEAKKEGLTPITTDFFTADTTPAGVPPSPAFNTAAFGLSNDSAISKVIELENGVAVLHLAEIQPSELRPLDEVKVSIQKQLLQTKSIEESRVAAGNAAKALQDAVAKGTDFKAAAAALKLKVETVPTFVPFDAARNDPKLQSLAIASASMKPGAVSEPTPNQADDSSVVIHLDSRAKPDPAGLADFETRVRDHDDQQLRNLAFADWTMWKSKQPGTHKPAQLDAYGGVE
jgi:SurA N-terminal domain/PPIC-type PPIASE domain